MLNCEDIKVSLVVPVYNIEKYLPKNIESLIKQKRITKMFRIED
jgi:glycosyltransferase involved in cell wall biosynthesis